MASVRELEALREAYLAERPLYEALSAEVARVAGTATRKRGVHCRVEYRAKDVASLIKKTVRKGYADVSEVSDRAGARVIVTFADAVPQVEEALREALVVLWREDKSEALEADRLGYLGIHYGVRLLPGDSANEYGERACELQLHTTAQRAWADASHDLLYKQKELPSRLSRPVNRLMALMEIFDETVVGTRQTLKTMPEWKEAAVLEELERYFFELTARDYDAELSLLILKGVVAAHGNADADLVKVRVADFVASNRERIAQIFQDYADDPRLPLLLQPETLAVFERLSVDPFVLKEEWGRVLPVEFLERTAEVWGVAI